MLSPGKWYLEVPTDQIENVKFRRWVVRRCARDLNFRRAIVKACSQDIIFFISVFVWQFNPKKKGLDALGPFIPWDYQIEATLAEPKDEDDEDGRGLLWCYEHDQDVVIEKSRDMGISWLMLIIEEWLCRFTSYVKVLNISKNAEAVDDPDPDSLFWKVRFIHQWLPEWMQEGMVERSMLFAFPGNSFITGTASTSSAGVSGRASSIFVDEYPRIKEDTAVRAGTASTSDSRFFNGTHQGTATEFYRMTQTPEFVKFVFHWSQHPDKNKGLYRWNPIKNQADILDKSYVFPDDYQFDTSGKPLGGPHPGLRSPWYDKKAASIGSDVEVAQELDINASGSVSQFFEPQIVKKLALEFCRRPEWEGDLVKIDGQYRLVEKAAADDFAPLKFWIRPDLSGKFPEATYKLAADLSQGTGNSNSCVSILNADIGVRVGEYVSPKIYPEHLAPIVVWMCKLFVDEAGNPAQLAWEANGPGVTFGMEVLKLGFRNIYWHDPDPVSSKFKRLPPLRPGWYSERKAKKALLSAYRFALVNRDFLNQSELAMEETLLFQLSLDGNTVFHSGSLDKRDPSGAGENHGDRVIGDALVLMLAAGHQKVVQQEDQDAGPPVGSVLWRRQWRLEKANRRGRVR